MVGYTIVVGASKEKPVTGKHADVIQAAYTAAEAALRLLKPGKTNYDITDTLQKLVVDEFELKLVEGMLSNQMTKDVLDGPKHVVLNPSDQLRKDIAKSEFETGEVYAIDVFVSSGEGKAKQSSARTTVFKRNAATRYDLKMKTSRSVLSDIVSKFGAMGFNLRHLEDEKKARMGIVECAKHQLVTSYDVVEEKEGDCRWYHTRNFFQMDGLTLRPFSLYFSSLLQAKL
jgi:curved DNA binding protein